MELVFTWFESTGIVLILLCVSGLLIAVINVLFITTLQISSLKHLLGRVMSLLFMGSIGLQPLSYFMTGLLISLTSLQVTYIIAGSIIVVFSCVFLVISNYLEINKESQKSIDINREQSFK